MQGSTQFDQTTAISRLRNSLQELVSSGRFVDAHAELHRMLVASGMTFEGRTYAYNPAPLLIAEADANAICGRAEELARILDKVGALYGSERSVRRYFDCYSSLEPLTTVDVPYRPIAHLNRFDTAWLGGDRFKVLEPNCCCPAGVTSNALTRRAWRSVPAFNDLISDYRIVDYPIDDLTTFAASLKEMARRHGKPGVIALANYKGCFTFELDFIVATLQAQGCEAVIADIADFTYRNGRLLLNGAEVSLVYNKLDQLMFRDGFDHLDYFKAYRDGAFVCINSFRSQIVLEDKAVLAFLCDGEHAGLFDRREKSIIDAHIPWTAYVRDKRVVHPAAGSVNLVSFMMEHRKDLVLKPTNQTRGAGVSIGRAVEPAAWQEMIRSACGGEWIVQEYCELPQSPSVGLTEDKHYSVEDWQYSLDIFMLGGRAIGLTSRSNQGDIINVGSGGMRRPVCVIGDDIPRGFTSVEDISIAPSSDVRPTLRPAIAEDSTIIATIWHDAWHATHAGDTHPDVVAWRGFSWFAERAARAVTRTTSVIERGKRVVGFVSCNEDKLDLLFMDLHEYGSGIADVLLMAAESAMARASVTQSYLYCRTTNERALRFYQKRGWSIDTGVEEQLICASGTRPSLVWRMVKTLDDPWSRLAMQPLVRLREFEARPTRTTGAAYAQSSSSFQD